MKRQGSSTRARRASRSPSRPRAVRAAPPALARELAELVEEEDAAVRERDLAGPRRVAAADQPGGGDRVVRGAERARDRATAVEAPATLAIRATSSASAAQRRQDRGQPPRRQRLPGAGRADHQQAVAAGGGDLERPAQARLAAQVGEVGAVRRSRPSGSGSGAAAAATRRATARGSWSSRSSGTTARPSTSAASGPLAAATIAARCRPRAPPRPSPARRRRAARVPSSASSPASAQPASRPPGAGPRRPAARRRSRGRTPGRPCAGRPARG